LKTRFNRNSSGKKGKIHMIVRILSTAKAKKEEKNTAKEEAQA
jgi:hypothetical protein